MALYDFLYVDIDKVISLYSQLTGGVVEVREASTETLRTADNKRRYDFKVFQHDAGGTASEAAALKESIKPHHSLLTELEKDLHESGHLVDFTQETGVSLGDFDFRQRLKTSLCIKVRGRAVVEDYERIKSIAAAFPDIAKLINRSIQSSLESSAEYKEIESQLAEAKSAVASVKDRNERARKKARLSALQSSIGALAISKQTVGTVDQWVLDGLKTWIDSFLPGIVNIRIYPDASTPEEHVFGHLKRSCFEDTDSGSFHFTYGSLPTEELTLLGVITSVPEQGGEKFDPLREFQKDQLQDYESVESAFRGLFRGFDGMEQMIRTCRFPRILTYPLMVYRSV